MKEYCEWTILLGWLDVVIDNPCVFVFFFLHLYNDMILFTLSIISCGFTFGLFKRPHTNGDVFLIYKSMINP